MSETIENQPEEVATEAPSEPVTAEAPAATASEDKKDPTILEDVIPVFEQPTVVDEASNTSIEVMQPLKPDEETAPKEEELTFAEKFNKAMEAAKSGFISAFDTAVTTTSNAFRVFQERDMPQINSKLDEFNQWVQEKGKDIKSMTDNVAHQFEGLIPKENNQTENNQEEKPKEENTEEKPDVLADSPEIPPPEQESNETQAQETKEESPIPEPNPVGPDQ